ncbi:hypothetical protein ARAM_006500 [Aspergillus rambellii]|uniref:Dienelactone hydrolase domain-containing protein n=1 Tax=Aspergillus rambellii TaxID=308745 RepID=A0A0F8XUC0_9EURO|nr:hypothetical protein ARAM_006500 [Aspergillus rambellii]
MNHPDITGPETATKAILVIYDIFGFFPQTIQGADLLATSGSQKYRIVMPDFFQGHPADISWFPPRTPEHKQKLADFFHTTAAPPSTLAKIPGCVARATAEIPGIRAWSILGYCWGGKIAVLSSSGGGGENENHNENPRFRAAVLCHPAMLDPRDARAVKVPLALLASKDENPQDVEAFGANLTPPHYVETFASQIHGWMAARADLADEQVSRERASAPHIQVPENGLQTKIREFFRRRREPSPNRAETPVVAGIEKTGSPRPASGSNPPRRHASVHARQDSGGVHPPRADAIAKNTPRCHYHLTRKDVEMIFSGAPYFLLEKGKQDQWYPHVIFPFDDHDPTIQSLWDRRALPYASYTLCTLHAHLPIPAEWSIEGDAPGHLDRWQPTGSPKRASFDVGMFEVPNMLSMNGTEPGSVGFHYFLEMPVADSLRFPGSSPVSPFADLLRLSTLPATEVYSLMEHHNDPYALCADGTVHSRKTLLLEGPLSWKRIGVREIDLQHLVERLQTLKNLRYEILHGEQAKTILDLEGTRELFSGLFTKFLYPPSRFMLMEGEEPYSLQSQIKALTLVLATPGAVVGAAAPCGAGPAGPFDVREAWVHPTLERKWFLVQMVLAAELLLRLDATVRVGLLQNSRELDISAKDIHDFEQLRNAKVNWDMIAVRRLMESFHFTSNPVHPPEPLRNAREKQSVHHSFLETLTHRTSSPVTTGDESAWWKCHLAPEYVDQQLQGLFVFAENICWPRLDELKQHFQPVFGKGKSAAVRDAYNRPVRRAALLTANKKDHSKNTSSRSLSSRPVMHLQYAPNDPEATDIDGWITRTWLSGLVLPGDGISHLLMATILENDADAMALLGPRADLSGGFAYRGRSWWSKDCIVGRVISSLGGTQVCMGWIASHILPQDSRSMEALDNTWVEISVKEPQPGPGKPRIQQGNKISLESTPLGLGDVTSGAFSLPVDDAHGQEPLGKIDFQALMFDAKRPPGDKPPGMVAPKASLAFSLPSGRRGSARTITFPLQYNVQFIASHECRPPGGLLSYCAPVDHDDAEDRGPRRHRLRGHPLHRSYAYQVIPLDSLPDMVESDRSWMMEGIMVLDARGGPEREAFARAWCASVGQHAILGRVGRTCLACSIREARAIKVGVVIRVTKLCEG